MTKNPLAMYSSAALFSPGHARQRRCTHKCSGRAIIAAGDFIAGLHFVEEAVALLVDESPAAANRFGNQIRGLLFDGRVNLNSPISTVPAPMRSSNAIPLPGGPLWLVVTKPSRRSGRYFTTIALLALKPPVATTMLFVWPSTIFFRR